MGIVGRAGIALLLLLASGTARGDGPTTPIYGTVRAGTYVPRTANTTQLGAGYEVELGVGFTVLPFLSFEISTARTDMAGPAIAGGSSNGQGVDLVLMPILASARFQVELDRFRPWVTIGAGAYYFSVQSQGVVSGPYRTSWSGFGPGLEVGGGLLYQLDSRTAVGVATAWTHPSAQHFGLLRADGLVFTAAFEYRI